MLHPVPTNSSVKASACAELRTNLGKKKKSPTLRSYSFILMSRLVLCLCCSRVLSAPYALVTWILYTALPLQLHCHPFFFCKVQLYLLWILLQLPALKCGHCHGLSTLLPVSHKQLRMQQIRFTFILDIDQLRIVIRVLCHGPTCFPT